MKLMKGLSYLLLGLLFILPITACSSNQSSNPSQTEENTTDNSANDSAETKTTSPDFPNQSITIVLPSAAGAPIDVQSRKLAEVAPKYLNDVSIQVLNKPGGSGMVAMAYTQSQPADGYTVHAEATGITSVLQMRGAQFEYTDFIPLSRVELDPFTLYVKDGGKYNSLEDFIAEVKKHPGEITVGGYGTGSPHHIMAMQFAKQAGIDIKWVAFKSGSDAITEVMGGNIDAALSNASAMPRFEGKVKILAHSAEDPLPKYPDIPSFKDQGFDISKYHWRGLFVKKGTPEEIVNILATAFNKAIKDPEFQAYLDTVGNLNGYMPRDEFNQMIKGQADGDLEALKELGLAE